MENSLISFLLAAALKRLIKSRQPYRINKSIRCLISGNGRKNFFFVTNSNVMFRLDLCFVWNGRVKNCAVIFSANCELREMWNGRSLRLWSASKTNKTLTHRWRNSYEENWWDSSESRSKLKLSLSLATIASFILDFLRLKSVNLFVLWARQAECFVVIGER